MGHLSSQTLTWTEELIVSYEKTDTLLQQELSLIIILQPQI
jgi:hypothetical protein